MKQKITSLLTAGLLLLSLSGCGTASPDGGKMREDMTAMDYAQEMGIGINLGNTMEAYWQDTQDKTAGASTIGENTPLDYEKCWGAVETTQECIDGMKAAGFNTVRVPVYWGNMMEDDGKFQINEDYMNRVAEIVDYCRNQELYVIINVHHYDEFLIKNHPQEKVLEVVEDLWTVIAKRFRNYSDFLVFEGFNEALGSQPEGGTYTEAELFDYVNAMNQTFVDAVRATGGNNAERVLIASGYWTNIDLTTNEQYVMPEDSAEDRMMVSVHYIDNAPYWGNSIGNQYWLSYSSKQCTQLEEAFTSKGIPVFVGECTSIYTSDHLAPGAQYTDSSECLSILLNKAVDFGFVPVLWDVNDNFYSRTEYKIKSESDAAVIQEIAARIANEE
ncbi:MAG: glycoside hydrolase family 5 protein [Oscillospiraceae bacterium]|nr:glycoside hydrolase family 5 protein [Oscillospiraceae bacterium]